MADDGDGVVGGRYVLGRLLGRGGMAEVREAYDQRLGRAVAVKQLSAHLAADPDAHVRLDREAHAAASLNHPAIASVFDTGVDTESGTGVATPFIVMELVDGETLRSLLRSNGPMPLEQALRFTSRVLDALDHSHSAGIIHRDIKPSNVMVTSTGAVKVMDFGIARAIDDTSNGLTGSAIMIGTVHYLSPEQASGRPVDPRSDLYSVGCLLYELLTGRPPFVGDSQISVAYQHVSQPAAPPSSVNPAISAAVDAVFLRALAKNPDDRYQTAKQMQAELDRLSAASGRLAAAPSRGVPAVVTPAAVPPTPTMPDSSAVATAPGSALDPQTNPPRRSGARRSVLIAVAVFLVLGFGALAAIRLLPGPDSPSVVAVPSLIGLERAAAEADLRRLGLEPKITNVNRQAGDSLGTVIRQTPPAGREVALATVVTLEVNAGPAPGAIPKNLVGDQLEEAKDQLATAGFTNIDARPVADPTGRAEPGEVLTVNPAEGASAALDAQVILRYVRRGKAVDPGRPTTRPTANPTGPAVPSERPTADPTDSEPSDPQPTDPQPSDPATSAAEPSPPPAETSQPTPTTGPTKKGKPGKTPKPSKPPKSPKATP